MRNLQSKYKTEFVTLIKEKFPHIIIHLTTISFEIHPQKLEDIIGHVFHKSYYHKESIQVNIFGLKFQMIP